MDSRIIESEEQRSNDDTFRSAESKAHWNMRECPEVCYSAVCVSMACTRIHAINSW